MGQLRGNQMDVVHEADSLRKDDIIVINTCGFIDNAKQESIDTILQYSELKDQGKISKLIVTGCLSERYKPELEAEIKNVDSYFGTNDLQKLLSSVGADYKHELLGERLLTTPSHFAYFKIAEGCNRPCSFCAIPLMRGKHVSKPIEDLVKEAKFLAKNGTKELILIAQDLTYYGLDLYSKRNLADLLRNLSDVDGIEWIRLQYAYPSGFPMDILEVMNERSNICNYLDMPLQHASNNMLKAMKRQITREEMETLIASIREQVPGICIRTTLITGFPGETREDVEELKDFLVRMRFDRVGIFTYSHEENTTAHDLEDNIPAEEKEARAQEIMEVQQEISLEKNQEKLGQIFKVIVDKKEAGRYLGRTEFDSVEVDNEVVINTDQKLVPGQFVMVKITKAYDYDLEGDLI
jgi:ribosomal protein S12 methylthiotransferase